MILDLCLSRQTKYIDLVYMHVWHELDPTAPDIFQEINEKSISGKEEMAAKADNVE